MKIYRQMLTIQGAFLDKGPSLFSIYKHILRRILHS